MPDLREYISCERTKEMYSCFFTRIQFGGIFSRVTLGSENPEILTCNRNNHADDTKCVLPKLSMILTQYIPENPFNTIQENLDKLVSGLCLAICHLTAPNVLFCTFGAITTIQLSTSPTTTILMIKDLGRPLLVYALQHDCIQSL